MAECLVLQECKHCSSNWFMIGSNLGISYYTLNNVKSDHRNDCERCMMEMLAKWLKKVDNSTPNWRSLCHALYSIDRSTADQIAKKHDVPEYIEKKECIVRDDVKQAVSRAKTLKDEFKKLLRVAYIACNDKLDLLKLCLNLFFRSEGLTTPQYQQLLKELNTLPTSLDVFNCLIGHNFVGYLNYKVLEEIQKMVENEQLKTDIELYEKKHDTFLQYFSFKTIIEMFNKHPKLAPVSHIGLPEFEIHLEEPWNDKYVYEWTEFFELRSSWSPYLLVTGVSRMCIVITYAVLPFFVSSVVRDLTNPEILRDLEENGVTVQLSKELLEINNMISKPATNGNSEKHSTVYNRLSFSDGCIHMLGIGHEIAVHTPERWNDSNRKSKASILHSHKGTGEISVIDKLNLEVTDKQLTSLLLAVPSSEKQESPILVVGETTKTDPSETELPVSKENECSDNQHEKLSSPLYQEPDQILQALKSMNVTEIAQFLSLYDLHVTEQQKIKFLSLVSLSETLDFQFPTEMNPFNVLVSVIHETESKIHKAVNAKEAELTKERKELMNQVETYKKISLKTIQELHGIKSLQSMKEEEPRSMEEDGEDYSKEDIQVDIDKHEEKIADKVEILLEDVESYQKIIISKDSEIKELQKELQKKGKRIELLVSKLEKERKDVGIQYDPTAGADVEAVWHQISTRTSTTTRSTRTSTTTTGALNYDDLDDFSFAQRQDDGPPLFPSPTPPPVTKRHLNAVTVAEVIDRVDSAFLPTTGNIAAIDFGTANCSIAYCTTKDEQMRLLKLSSQEGQIRVPTILLVNEKGEPIKFGKRAVHQYQRLDPSQRLKYHLFERIKLALGPHEDISRDTTIPDINGKMFFLRDVIALFIKFLKDELEKCFQMLNINFTATDFHWVITVPAIWSASGKQMTREAAYQAGLCGTHTIESIAVVTRRSHIQKLEVKSPERLSLALEPEAASFFCRTMNEQDIIEYSIPQAGIPKRDKYIVVDIGGGTADFSAHGLTSEGHIEVLTSPEGNLSGGMAVNQEFEHFLTDLVRDPGFSTYLSTGDDMKDIENKLDVRNIVYDEFEEEKKEFGQTDVSKSSDNTVFKIELSDRFYKFYEPRLEAGINRLNLQKHDRRVTLGRRKMLCISYSKMEEFFLGPVANILASLKDILIQLNNDVRTIFLVGGFGGCKYMYYRVQEELKLLHGADKIRIIVPDKPHLAVVQGAIQYCKNPELVRSRVADTTYGTETLAPFNQKIHDVRYYHKTKSGEKLCKHLFSPLVIEGERVGYNQVKRNVYQPVDPSYTSVKFNLLTSDDKDLFYTRSTNGVLKEGVKVLATITLPTPNTDQGTDRDLYLSYNFSHTEIQVHAYDESSNSECRVVLDCLPQSRMETIIQKP